MGIAEANMMAAAAGIASCGKVVFASTFAMFASGRAFEQIRNSICYSNLDVKIGASHSGLTVGEDGASHQTIEDIAIMRVIPNMTVVCPADAVEARHATIAAYKTPGPFYLRLTRLAVPVIFECRPKMRSCPVQKALWKCFLVHAQMPHYLCWSHKDDNICRQKSLYPVPPPQWRPV